MSSHRTDVHFPVEVEDPIRDFLTLYREELSTLSFPDVDLSRLESRVDAVRTAVDAVAVQREALARAQSELDEALSSLAKGARRAYAYAQVFAQGDEALTQRLKEIPLGPAGERKKRGRPPGKKNRVKKEAGPELPLQTETRTEEETAAA